ncbi:GNAT family N-acetyltransferase [Streptomyces liangshanensis]|uniref:GNAT family N-acetyltransferase n=1 Tax=Streptomyces liangshanensis TaxID=2717324 RepID=A0A6G9H8M8_9ACTN|nr:GNAT family N-acetyltransferase [Streptomyces liangshanensis]
MRIRPISPGDWDGIVALEAGAYTALGLSEERDALESRVRASPATCFALDAEQGAVGHALAGYVLALPYPEHGYPDLTRAEEPTTAASPHRGDRNLHLHDLVIDERLRGRGLARTLLRHLLATARSEGYERISLIAVNGSDTFWGANGFAPHEGVAPEEGYGPGAVYMSRAVPDVPDAPAVPDVPPVPGQDEVS